MARTRAAALTGATVALLLYAVPLLVERLLLYTTLSAWLVCVVMADLPGAVVLYKLCFRKTAVAVYAVATVVEGYLLSHGMMPLRLVWFTNIVPAPMAGILIFILADFNPGPV